MKFELNEFHRDISADELISDLQLIICKNESETLTYSQYRKCGGKYSKNTFLRRFGGWLKALE